MKNIIVITILIFISCDSSQKNNLEINVLNDSLVAFDYKLKKDYINIIKIEVINNSDDVFYFNNIYNSDSLILKLKPQEILSKNIFNFKIFDENNKIVSYDEIRYIDNGINEIAYRSLSKKKFESELKRLKSEKYFRYYSSKDYNRFFIHPKEKLYFEFYLNLSDTLSFEYDRIRIAKLNRNKEYFAKLFMMSDSTNYKKELPLNVLKNIEANNVKVYHGIIESKNKVPIKVLE